MRPSCIRAKYVDDCWFRLDLRLETPQLLVLLFELGQDGIAVPVHLETELELVLHFLEDVAEHVVRVLEELDRVFFRS